jgi:uracil-DNA glycosylase
MTLAPSDEAIFVIDGANTLARVPLQPFGRHRADAVRGGAVRRAREHRGHAPNARAAGQVRQPPATRGAAVWLSDISERTTHPAFMALRRSDTAATAGDLRAVLPMVTPYPAGVRPVPTPIRGTAFFPGGDGLWHFGDDSDGPRPAGGVMVLGHNFDSERGFAASMRRGQENLAGPTWRHLLAVLDEAGVPRETCFFTNLFMGLIAGDRATGAFPGARDAPFVDRCLAFLRVQLAWQRPRCVLALGGHVVPLLGRLAPDLAAWSRVRRLRDLDECGLGLMREVTIVLGETAPPLRCTVAALTHPSFRPRNVANRSYRGRTGHLAEIALLQDALGDAFSSASVARPHGALTPGTPGDAGVGGHA